MATWHKRLMPLGSTLSGVGGSLCVGYLIYSLQDASRSFWHWPGILGVAVLFFGALAMIGSFLVAVDDLEPAEAKPVIVQKQVGGRDSVNYQAGGNIKVDPVESKRRKS
ncbi:hypothetical protein JOD54_000623 [Actinokineospora baliensis]|uniref:hypothetical protein n=1 Tax=Actinokineospora baliensis TaxID=547056 RepID=UPI001957296F|nr:hypothetical protein [Actinokineospora baliensis]MBM7770419.1 hypothetical protein [Actinokineospora baliensis]